MSSEPVIYFFQHSGLFVVITAAIFSALGLWFGYLTWGRYKRRSRALTSESEDMKNDIAALKRKIAELTAKLSLASQPQDEAASEPPSADKPDPTIGSLIARAATILNEPSWPISSASSEKKASAESAAAPSPAEPAKPEASKPAKKKSADKKPAADESPPRSGPLAMIATHAAKKIEEMSDTSPPAAEVNEKAETAAASASEPAADEAKEKSAGTPPQDLPAASGEPSPAEARLVSDPLLGLVYSSPPASPDDLTQIKGVASVLDGRLNEFGIHTYKQIALWSEENVREFSSLLAFKDRILREMWVEQARELHFQKFGERV